MLLNRQQLFGTIALPIAARRIPMGQKQLLFHYDPVLAPNPSLPAPPSMKECIKLIDHTNPDSPFSKYVGQDSAKRKMGRVLLSALQKPNHCAADVSWLLTGPSSVGKTTLARIFAQILNLPFIELHPKSLKSLNDIFEIVNEKLIERKPILQMNEVAQNQYKMPPCIIFIDEAHSLPRSLQNGLLKATETKDRTLVTEDRKTIDTKAVTFIMATTDSGDLFDAFLNRFTEINLVPYTKQEIAQIIRLNFPEWGEVESSLAAHFQPRIPRKAIDFAKEMKMEKEINPQKKWHQIAVQVAEENNIDEHGLPLKHLQLLQAVSRRPVSKERITMMLNVKIKELTNYILPWLMNSTSDNPALITISTAGIRLTYQGYIELKKRNLVHVVPKYLEEEVEEYANG
jgi:Holliday junction resolvasome RuvABC ATP-dependent DNA helicase subunit